MTDVDVLKIALSKEENAIETYQKMLAENPGLKDLLSLLITEEQKHKILIEKKIWELTQY
jgi:rubrerythrin